LQRGSLVAWTAGAVLFGLLLGAVSPSISRFVDVPEVQGWVSRMGARDAGDAFLFMVMYVLGQAISAYAIAAALRLRAEETDGHADPVLATAVSRLRWATSHLFFAIIGSAIALALLGLTIGLAYGLSTGDVTHELPRLLGRTMVMLPAIWVLA
jgi:ABC-2 type transport system permease protein